MPSIPFNNQYHALGEQFYERIKPEPVSSPCLIRFNHALADEMGISVNGSGDDEIAAIFAGNIIPEGAEPIALAYSGHQFGHFNPQLGDGRALLLGEVAGKEGSVMGIHLKGSGPTRFSRNGDGRAALGPVLREYLVSEAMYKLGVPTTRALAAVTTGEEVARESLVPGGVITRVASSFVRVGTFEYFATRGDMESIRILADHVIKHNYPDVTEAENSYASLLQAVTDRQAKLIAQWMHLGFIHGVMNTDNMSVAGETIDYGPCAFMDAYRQDQVFSSIDRYGRYAYNNQPAIALWNLTRLAECLVPLVDEDMDEGIKVAQEILEGFRETHEQAWLQGLCAKCGLSHDEEKDLQKDKELVEDLLQMMEDSQTDFTITFSTLSELSDQPSEEDNAFYDLFYHSAKSDRWLARWRDRLQTETTNNAERQRAMREVNPVYIPRNHQIEKAIRAAEDHDDFSVFYELHEVLQNPFTVQEGKQSYASAPTPEEQVLKTFCGT